MLCPVLICMPTGQLIATSLHCAHLVQENCLYIQSTICLVAAFLSERW